VITNRSLLKPAPAPAIPTGTERAASRLAGGGARPAGPGAREDPAQAPGLLSAAVRRPPVRPLSSPQREAAPNVLGDAAEPTVRGRGSGTDETIGGAVSGAS